MPFLPFSSLDALYVIHSQVEVLESGEPAQVLNLGDAIVLEQENLEIGAHPVHVLQLAQVLLVEGELLQALRPWLRRRLLGPGWLGGRPAKPKLATVGTRGLPKWRSHM